MELFEQLAAQGAMIERLTSDSRRCAPGSAFFAYPGEKADGRAYIGDALQRTGSVARRRQDGSVALSGERVHASSTRSVKRSPPSR